MARQARKNTNLVENLKEINYRFHTYRMSDCIGCQTTQVSDCTGCQKIQVSDCIGCQKTQVSDCIGCHRMSENSGVRLYRMSQDVRKLRCQIAQDVTGCQKTQVSDCTSFTVLFKTKHLKQCTYFFAVKLDQLYTCFKI